ncbi:hypothetical protein Tco_1144536 [Tanacetum coccineum]
MSAITDIRCALTQKALDAFYTKFHIREEVHPVFPNQNDTMHERPAGKIRLYTRFFDYANFRFPLSTFLVDVLRHFRINISQLSVIGAAKVDDFACPASFPWHTAKHVTRDPAPVVVDFNAQDYATLVALPSPFRKFPEAFLCLVGLSRYYPLDEETYPWFCIRTEKVEMDIFAFIHTPDPTKVKIFERERNEDKLLLMVTTIGCTIPLLPVMPDRVESKLEASVDRLFDEGGSGNQAEQGDYTGVGEGANIQPVIEAVDTDVEVMAPVDAKVREDHEAPSRTFVGGKSRSVIKSLLARAVLNTKVRVAAIPTLPFVTAFVSSTLEREGGDHTDSVDEPNLHTIGASQRFVISSDSSHHSGHTIAEVEVDSLVKSFVLIMMTVTTVTSTVNPALVAKEKSIEPSLFSVDSSSASGANPYTGVFLDLTDSDFLIGEKRRLKSEVEKQNELLKFREEEIGNLKAQLLLREVEARKAICLRAEASNFEAVEKFLQDELIALKEHNAILKKEQNALDVKVTDHEASPVSKERELTNLNALVTSVKSQNDNLADQVHELVVSSSRLQEKVTVYENCIEQLEKFQDDQMKVVNNKFDKLYTDFVEMALHLEEKFYPHLLTTISSRIWLLTQGMKLAITKCLNSPEYLFALGEAIGKAIDKGMRDGLSARITHGKEGIVLTDVAAHNPSMEVDYINALQRLQNVNFPLLGELKSSKDVSIEAVMNILFLEEPLAKKLGLNELQPNVDQLMVPIHHSPNKVIIGATALSLALDVSSIRVRKIRENIENQRSVLRDVFVPLAEPFSVAALTGTEGTFVTVAATADTTMALSTTFASASTIAPISVDDYEVIGTDDRTVADEHVASFPNVDDAELNIPQSTSVVLSVGMPISARMTASVLYVNENGVSSLLDFIKIPVEQDYDLQSLWHALISDLASLCMGIGCEKCFELMASCSNPEISFEERATSPTSLQTDLSLKRIHGSEYFLHSIVSGASSGLALLKPRRSSVNSLGQHFNYTVSHHPVKQGYLKIPTQLSVVILPEHPSDTKEHLKMEMEIPCVKASANSVIIFFFTSAQDGNRLLDDERLCLDDDLKKAHDQNQNKSK